MNQKTMQFTWSDDDDSNDNINEEDCVGGLVVYNDVSKHTNSNVQESNIRGASSSKALHIVPYKKDTESRLDTTVQHDNNNNDLDSDVSDNDINDKKDFRESYKMMFTKYEEVYNKNTTLMT